MGVVVQPPAVEHPASLAQAQEQFSFQELIAKLSVEGLDVTVLPGAAFGDEQGPYVGLLKPSADNLGYELRPVVAAYVPRCATDGKEVLQDLHYVLGRNRG